MSATLLRNTAPAVWTLQGALTFDTVPQLWSETDQWLSGTLPLSLDLIEVGVVDSAGLALLLGWKSRAQLSGIALHYLNLPQRLLAIASITDTKALLTGA